jgi:hypothetical protein
MTTDKTALDVLLVVEDGKFFTRAKSGAIWGTVYFQVGDNQFFPQKGWTDLVAGFVAPWLEGLLRVTKGISAKERVCFFDGPFAVDISLTQKGLLNLSFVHREKSELSEVVEVKQLLAHSDSVARELCSKRREHKGWNNQDTDALAALIRQIRY